MTQKPIRQLLQDMIQEFDLKPGDIFTKEQTLAWFQHNYPKIKQGTVVAHLLRFSVNAPSRVHHLSTTPEQDDWLYQIDNRTFRLYVPVTDPPPIYIHTVQEDIDRRQQQIDNETQATDFAYKHDLQRCLAKNLDILEPGLRLYTNEGIVGLDFPTVGRFIDILALDSDDNLVVIELKVSKGYDRVIGQLLRYMAWTEKHQAEAGQQVRGMIVARKISEDLRLACSLLRHVTLYEYEISVKVKPIALE